MWNHWVARACTPFEPFKDFETGRWTWTALTRLFPEMISGVLMPNHLHMILPATPQEGELGQKVHPVVSKKSGLLGVLSRRKEIEKLWQPIPRPAVIPDRLHLRRQIRYIALNPCRKGLCADPLSWYWSTHRELVGATVERQESAVQLAGVLGELVDPFKVRFHRYVSADPSVDVKGTPFPKAAVPGVLAEMSIREILAASAGALRVEPSDVAKEGRPRMLFVHLAYRHGWRQPSLLAKICGITPHGVRKILKKPVSASWMAAADLCLGDSRLRSEKGFDFSFKKRN